MLQSAAFLCLINVIEFTDEVYESLLAQWFTEIVSLNHIAAIFGNLFKLFSGFNTFLNSIQTVGPDDPDQIFQDLSGSFILTGIPQNGLVDFDVYVVARNQALKV